MLVNLSLMQNNLPAFVLHHRDTVKLLDDKLQTLHTIHDVVHVTLLHQNALLFANNNSVRMLNLLSGKCDLLDTNARFQEYITIPLDDNLLLHETQRSLQLYQITDNTTKIVREYNTTSVFIRKLKISNTLFAVVSRASYILTLYTITTNKPMLTLKLPQEIATGTIFCFRGTLCVSMNKNKLFVFDCTTGKVFFTTESVDEVCPHGKYLITVNGKPSGKGIKQLCIYNSEYNYCYHVIEQEFTWMTPFGDKVALANYECAFVYSIGGRCLASLWLNEPAIMNYVADLDKFYVFAKFLDSECVYCYKDGDSEFERRDIVVDDFKGLIQSL